MPSTFVRADLWVLVGAAVVAPVGPASAAEMQFGPNDIPTVFFISKSDDRNRVDYGIRLDAACQPVGDDPVFYYWRIFEGSPPVRTHDHSVIDRIPYGIAEQKVQRRTATGAEHYLRLKQLAGRAIVIDTKKEPDGRCSAMPRAVVNGTTARLLSVFVKLAGFASVDYIDILGKHLETGAAITERVKK